MTEVDLVVRPGTGQFRGPAECRLLVATCNWPRSRRLEADRAARQADVSLVAAANDRSFLAELTSAL